MPQGDRNCLVDATDSCGNEDLETTRTGNVQRYQDGLSNSNQEGGQQSADEPIKYTSQLAALFIIVNVTVGAGLLAMPYAMQTSGLVTSVVFQVIFLLMIITTCIMCTELTVKNNANSYHQVVKKHAHPIIFKLTQAAILLIVFGTTVAFIVIIGDQADRVFATAYGPTFCYNWYLNRRFIMSAVTFFVMKPLCSAKTVDFLKYGSFAGVLSLGFIMYVVISQFIAKGKIAHDVNYLPKSFADIGAVLPVFCLAYQCHLSFVPVAASIRREEKYTTYKTVSVAMIVATIIYMIVSVLAALTFGSAIQNDLTESYPGKDWPILTTIAIVAFKCMVTLPPAFLPARQCIIDILDNTSKTFVEFSESTKRFSVTYITLTAALALALFVPDILLAIDILGCLCVLFIFILPAWCYLSHIDDNRLWKQRAAVASAGVMGEAPITYSLKDKMKRATSFILIIFGSIMMVLVLYNSIEKIFSKTTSQPLCRKP